MIANLEIPFFKLSDVTKLYHEKLQQLDLHLKSRIHSYLKEKLMAHIPDLREHKKGKDILLIT